MGSADDNAELELARLRAEVARLESLVAEHDGLRESEEQFRRTFDLANVGVAHVSVTGRFIRVNDYFCQMLGRGQDELLDLTFQDLTHPDDLDADLGLLGQLLAGEIESYAMEKRYILPDGAVHWGELSVSLLRHADGTPMNFISVVSDIQARKQAQEQVELVLGEANHRIKNLLTVIGAVVKTSARSAASAQELEKIVSSKIIGIAASHDLLMGKYQTGAQLDKLILRQLDVFTNVTSNRVLLEGAPLELNPKAVHAFGMVLHELATNACKHGALSNEAGRVRIAWAMDQDAGTLTFSWVEEGGPPVVASGHKGFGTRTLERMLGGGLGGTARHSLLPEGARFEARLPAAEILTVTDAGNSLS
ncbi:PAS domain S-box protein [Novosphingobium sp. MMS21-SN21R]|uniref:PAS domain S-box protein n=1 Tax=Novosphingobium sp. MMS21-SN21R TaxID=2969298 RepID=UPI0028852399|nr:PAS domain S-box protein [Novosphingobium sp. MMS21-SN21R]MDT0509969.1 PAS domain S-box protein [Novosphingobium sp. MMS21-SN21R]